MKRTLLCLTAFALLGACGKKPTDTTPPGDPNGDTGAKIGDPAGGQTGVPQEPDPPAIAQAREQYMLGNYDKAKELLEPLIADLKTRQQLRASGLSAGWLALGSYQLGTDDPASAATQFEAAYKLHTDGPHASLALVLYGQAKVNMAFGGEEKDQIAHPEELDSAASTFIKAQRLAASQPGSEMVAARAYEGIASVANYKKNFKEACTQIAEAAKIYKTKSAGQPLIERVNAIMEAAKCEKAAG